MTHEQAHEWFNACRKAAAFWAALAASATAHAHDMHGLTHDHASGFLFLAVWLIVSAVLYFVDARR